MMTVDRPDSFKKFAKSCKDFLEENPLLYYFLDKTISDVLLGKIKFYFAFTITKGGVGRIVTLVAGDICLIYENGFDHEMFDEFCKQIEFHKFNRFNFAGSKKLIDTLFAKYGATFDSTKHRIIYNCNQVSQRCSYSPGSFRMANFADAEK